MRLLFSTITLAASIGAAHAQKPSTKILDEKYGFRDLKFETDTTSITGLQLIENDGHSRFYQRENENLKIGGSELSKISYCFYDGKLSSILITTKGLNNSRALLEALQEQYGSGWQSNPYIKSHSWLGKQVYMNYDENSLSGDAKVWLSSKKMSEVQRAAEKQTAKKAGADL